MRRNGKDMRQDLLWDGKARTLTAIGRASVCTSPWRTTGMMQAGAFDQWCHRLGLRPATRELLARLRAAPPVRRVQGRAQNVSGTYASRKMGLTIQFESHKVELWAIYAMEYDTQVLEYYPYSDTYMHPMRSIKVLKT